MDFFNDKKTHLFTLCELPKNEQYKMHYSSERVASNSIVCCYSSHNTFFLMLPFVLVLILLLISLSAVIRNDGVYHVIVDQVPFFKGNLLEDMEPAINPPAEIDDPNDKMPSDWDEREKLVVVVT